MDLAGLAGILASLLGLALTVSGVFFNGRATRALVEKTHRDTQTLIESTHKDSRVLLEAIQADIKAVSESVQAIHQNGQRRHDDLVAYMQDMDRRHTEVLTAIAKRP